MVIKPSISYVGVLLAGGASRRFGEPKAFAKIGGKQFYQYALEALKPSVEKTIIISQPSSSERFVTNEPCIVIEDVPVYQGMGPLAGLYSAMQSVSADWYILLPCDTPLINHSFIAKLVEFIRDLPDCDGLVPKASGRLQPLTAIYNRRCIDTIEQQLINRRLKMTDLMTERDIRIIEADQLGLDEAMFENINTKEQLKQTKLEWIEKHS